MPVDPSARETRRKFASLVQDGVLVPRAANPTIKSPWLIEHGLALVTELGQLAEGVEAGVPEWERLQLAHKRRGLGVGAMIALVRERNMVLGWLKGLEGYTGFCVREAESDALWHARSDAAAGTSARAKIGGMAASAFGRSLGIRDDGNLLAFVEAGHTPSTSVPHRLTGRPVTWVSDADIAAFQRRFVTTTILGRETGLHRNTIVMKLRTSCVTEFTADGRRFAGISLREDLKGVFST